MPRRPKPIHLQLAEGDPRKRGARKLREALEAEPKPTQGLPPCPAHLHGRAKDTWDFLAGALAAMNLDFQVDALALEGLCVNYARAIEADALIAKEGLTLGMKAHPGIAISNAAWRQFRAFCSEFGLSPASRTGLGVAPREDSIADIDKLLMQPRVRRDWPASAGCEH